MSENAAYPLTVYYDASCPLCKAEIESLKAMDEQGCLELKDCSGAGFCDADAEQDSISQPSMMRAMHVRDADGNWHQGIDSFIAVYRAVGMERVARMYSNPKLRPLWDRLYPWVARNRQWLSKFGLHRPFAWLIRRGGHHAGD